jgi:hypothetical protein
MWPIVFFVSANPRVVVSYMESGIFQRTYHRESNTSPNQTNPDVPIVIGNECLMKHKRKVNDHKTLEADTSDHLTDTFRRALWYGKSFDFSLNVYIKKKVGSMTLKTLTAIREK